MRCGRAPRFSPFSGQREPLAGAGPPAQRPIAAVDSHGKTTSALIVLLLAPPSMGASGGPASVNLRRGQLWTGRTSASLPGRAPCRRSTSRTRSASTPCCGPARSTFRFRTHRIGVGEQPRHRVAAIRTGDRGDRPTPGPGRGDAAGRSSSVRELPAGVGGRRAAPYQRRRLQPAALDFGEHRRIGRHRGRRKRTLSYLAQSSPSAGTAAPASTLRGGRPELGAQSNPPVQRQLSVWGQSAIQIDNLGGSVGLQRGFATGTSVSLGLQQPAPKRKLDKRRLQPVHDSHSLGSP